MSNSYVCFGCQTTVEGQNVEALAEAFLAHVRSVHADWPYPDQAVRNFAEATQRLHAPGERIETLGEVTIHPVTADRIDDWLSFFDYDAFADNPAWASCYCAEPHFQEAGAPPREPPHWRQTRESMAGLLDSGQCFGYLAYVDGRPAGWVNASRRVDYALYRKGSAAEPPDADVVAISCFVVAAAFRRHGIADRLLDRVVADAPSRGAAWVEAYPANGTQEGDSGNFRGLSSMYTARGFEAVETTERHTVVRRRV